MDLTSPPPRPGLCEHGKVRTLCPQCRQALLDAAPPTPTRPKWVHEGNRPPKREPKYVMEARVACSQCGSRDSARAYVELVEQRQYLCRKDARGRTFAHVEYVTSAKAHKMPQPTPKHWADILSDSRATNIRAWAKAPV